MTLLRGLSKILYVMTLVRGLPSSSVGKESAMLETQKTQIRSLSWEDPLRRAWQPTPVFLPGESHGQRNLVGYSLGSQRV